MRSLTSVTTLDPLALAKGLLEINVEAFVPVQGAVMLIYRVSATNAGLILVTSRDTLLSIVDITEVHIVGALYVYGVV